MLFGQSGMVVGCAIGDGGGFVKRGNEWCVCVCAGVFISLRMTSSSMNVRAHVHATTVDFRRHLCVYVCICAGAKVCDM